MKSTIITILAMLVFLSGVAIGEDTDNTMTIPEGGYFGLYEPEAAPLLSTTPETAKPLSPGEAVLNGESDTIEGTVGLYPFDIAVDLYLLKMSAPNVDPTIQCVREMSFLTENGEENSVWTSFRLDNLDNTNLSPWKSTVSEGVDEEAFEETAGDTSTGFFLLANKAGEGFVCTDENPCSIWSTCIKSAGDTGDSCANIVYNLLDQSGIEIFPALPICNNNPVSDAGIDQIVTVGDKVTLAGSGTDPDGDTITTYSWSLTAPINSNTQLNDMDTVNPYFTPDVEGQYTVALTVTDLYGGTSGSDGVGITVNPGTSDEEDTDDGDTDEGDTDEGDTDDGDTTDGDTDDDTSDNGEENVDGEEEWSKIIGGALDDQGNSVDETTDKGFIITGWTDSMGAGGRDIYHVRLDSDGNEIWAKPYGGTDDDEGNAGFQAEDGNFIIICGTESFGAGDSDACLIETDSNGDELLFVTYGDTGEDTAKSGQQTFDGGFILGGWTASYGGGYEGYLVKTDSDGIMEWTSSMGYNATNELTTSVYEVIDSDPFFTYIYYALTGFTSSSTGERDLYLVETDENGEENWARVFFGDGDNDLGREVKMTRDRGLIIVGDTNSEGAGGNDVYLIKTDSEGNEEWTKTYGGAGDDHGYSVDTTDDGGFIITGNTKSFGAGGSDVYVIKTSSKGTEQWSKTFGGSADDGGTAIKQTSDGGYILTGYTNSSGAGMSDLYVIKLKGGSGTYDEEEEDDSDTDDSDSDDGDADDSDDDDSDDSDKDDDDDSDADDTDDDDSSDEIFVPFCQDSGTPSYKNVTVQNASECSGGCKTSSTAYYGTPKYYQFTTIEGCSTIQLTLAGTNGINPDMIVKDPSKGGDLSCSDYDSIMSASSYGSKANGSTYWYDLSASYESEIINISNSTAGYTYQIMIIHGDSNTDKGATFRLEYMCF